MTTKTLKLDAYSDLAYTRWQGSNSTWTKQEFWDQLDAKERVAVFTTNFVGQVLNGGFLQWYDNQYATDETIGFLKRLCDRLATPATSVVKELLEKFETVIAELEASYRFNHGTCGEAEDFIYGQFIDACDKLNTLFYDGVDKDFTVDVEASL